MLCEMKIFCRIWRTFKHHREISQKLNDFLENDVFRANIKLKVHKNENFFDSDFGICVISLLVMHK